MESFKPFENKSEGEDINLSLPPIESNNSSSFRGFTIDNVLEPRLSARPFGTKPELPSLANITQDIFSQNNTFASNSPYQRNYPFSPNFPPPGMLSRSEPISNSFSPFSRTNSEPNWNSQKPPLPSLMETAKQLHLSEPNQTTIRHNITLPSIHALQFPTSIQVKDSPIIPPNQNQLPIGFQVQTVQIQGPPLRAPSPIQVVSSAQFFPIQQQMQQQQQVFSNIVQTRVTNSTPAAQLVQPPPAKKLKRSNDPPSASPNNGIPGAINLRLPLKLGSHVTVYNLGKVIVDRPSFHTANYIWPVGYLSIRVHRSFKNLNKITTFRCEVLEGKIHPVFKITPDDSPNDIVVDNDIERCFQFLTKKFPNPQQGFILCET